jgi:hypothetical protein
MKLQITNNRIQTIEGFSVVHIEKLDEELAKISHNECDLILATEAFDWVKAHEVLGLVQKLVQKCRMNGKIVVGGKDINAFAKFVLNSLISEEDASNMIAECKSMTNSSIIAGILASSGFQVLSVQMNGINYEITISRQPAA